MRFRHIESDYLRSIFFGLEDGLVSTTGAVIGISVATQDAKLVVLAGLVMIAVEAISMAAGEFLSEEAVHEFDHHPHHDSPQMGAVLMFGSYAGAGLIPLLPFMLLPETAATYTAISLAFISLFLLGYFKAKFTKVRPLRSGIEILIVGGVATLIGIAVGILLKT